MYTKMHLLRIHYKTYGYINFSDASIKDFVDYLVSQYFNSHMMTNTVNQSNVCIYILNFYVFNVDFINIANAMR